MEHTEIIEKLKLITLLLLDVDGVLTTGSIIYNNDGVETKIFQAKDGLGIKLLMDAGINVGIITGRQSEALYQRCRDLGIKLIFDGIHNKGAVIDEIIKKESVSREQIAFIGDDLPDLSAFKSVGFTIAVSDAHETLRAHADIITTAGGGKGAVREVCESILKAKELWEEIINSFNV